MNDFKQLEPLDEAVVEKLESIRRTTIATYTAVAHCNREVEDLEPKEQVATLLSIIRELTLAIDDITTDELLDDSGDECGDSLGKLEPLYGSQV